MLGSVGVGSMERNVSNLMSQFDYGLRSPRVGISLDHGGLCFYPYICVFPYFQDYRDKSIGHKIKFEL